MDSENTKLKYILCNENSLTKNYCDIKYMIIPRNTLHSKGILTCQCGFKCLRIMSMISHKEKFGHD